MGSPVLTLAPGWDAVERHPIISFELQLGDGYTINLPATLNPRQEWQISRGGLTREKIESLHAELKAYSGVEAFQWSPHPDIPKRLFYCEDWSITPDGPDAWSISTTFYEDVLGECIAFAAFIKDDDIAEWVAGAGLFLSSLTDGNNLAARYLDSSSGFVPNSAGTLYDQVTLALGCLDAYDRTTDSTWLTRATSLASAIANFYYNSAQGSGSLWLPNWLINIKTAVGGISPLQLFDVYPSGTPRALATGEVVTDLFSLPLLWDLYDRLYQATGTASWQTAANLTKEDTIAASVFSATSYYYRTNSGAVLEYPGTAIAGTNNTLVSSRVLSGALTDWVKLAVTGAASGSTATVQNTRTQTAVQTGLTIEAEAAHSLGDVVEVFFSLNSNPSNLNFIYSQYWLLPAGETANLRTFDWREFLKWSVVAWHPYRASAIAAVTTGSATVTLTKSESPVTHQGFTFPAVVQEAALTPSTGSAYLNLTLTSSSRNPFSLYIKVVGSPVLLRLRDAEGFYWDLRIEATGVWQLLAPAWTAFSWSPANDGSNLGRTPSTDGNIDQCQVHATDSGLTTLQLWWLSTAEPQRAITPAIAYRCGITSYTEADHDFWVGDFRPVGNSLDEFLYQPGATSFGIGITNGIGGGAVGLPYAGYQNPWGWYKLGDQTRTANAIAFLKAAQEAYSAQNEAGDVGPFSPVYFWPDWGNSSVTTENASKFGWGGVDTDATSGLYQARALESLARYWNENRSDREAQTIVIRFLGWLDIFQGKGNTQPPATFPETTSPVQGFSPGIAALFGKAALWANLAGGDAAITFRQIKRSLDYLESQYISSGVQLGSFLGSQSQYEAWWHSQALSFLSITLAEKQNITYPPCSEPLEFSGITTLEAICCGGSLVALCPTITLNTSLKTQAIAQNFQCDIRGGFLLSGIGTSASIRSNGTGAGTITFDSIPESATPCKALLYWNTIGPSATEFTTIKLNGQDVTGTKIGQSGDTCWLAEANKVYLADVTELVGENIASSYSVSNLPVGTGPAGDSQGCALFVLYKRSGAPLKRVTLFDGSYSIPSGSDSISVLLPRDLYRIGIAVSDGQVFEDTPVLLNQISIPGATRINGNKGSFLDIFDLDVSWLPQANPNIIFNKHYSDCHNWFLFATESSLTSLPPAPSVDPGSTYRLKMLMYSPDGWYVGGDRATPELITAYSSETYSSITLYGITSTGVGLNDWTASGVAEIGGTRYTVFFDHTGLIKSVQNFDTGAYRLGYAGHFASIRLTSPATPESVRYRWSTPAADDFQDGFNADEDYGFILPGVLGQGQINTFVAANRAPLRLTAALDLGLNHAVARGDLVDPSDTPTNPTLYLSNGTYVKLSLDLNGQIPSSDLMWPRLYIKAQSFYDSPDFTETKIVPLTMLVYELAADGTVTPKGYFTTNYQQNAGYGAADASFYGPGGS